MAMAETLNFICTFTPMYTLTMLLSASAETEVVVDSASVASFFVVVVSSVLEELDGLEVGELGIDTGLV